MSASGVTETIPAWGLQNPLPRLLATGDPTVGDQAMVPLSVNPVLGTSHTSDFMFIPSSSPSFIPTR